MNWKTILILAAGAILLSGTIFAQTHGSNTTRSQGTQLRSGSSTGAHGRFVTEERMAAEQGFASAQKNLGVQYGLGQGVPQSNAEAFIWSSIAAKSGDEGAVTNRDFAASQLSPTDLEAAQKRALTLYEGIQQRTEGG
jgi:hypothetical protein